MKWAIIILAAIIAYSLFTGYTGGAKDAASNYNKVLRPDK